MKAKSWICVVYVFVLWAFSPFFFESSEAALCVLRKPSKKIYAMFPEATGYRSVIKKVDKQARKKVEKYLGQKLDFDEVGGHTFYLVLKKKEVIGMVRPHAERGKYGIVEMVWAFTLDGRIKDFSIQRCRERGKDKIKREEFRKQFRGKTLKFAFTEGNTKKINSKLLKVPKKSERISSVIAYSAKKNLFLYKYYFPEYNKPVDKESQEKPKEDTEEKGDTK